MKEEIKQRLELIKNGQVPQGYKKTKVGIVPEDWEVTTLQKLGDFKKGKEVCGNNIIDNGLPAMMYGDIYVKYNIKFYNVDYRISEETAKKSTPVYKNDLLFTCSGETALEIGKCVCYLGYETIYIGGDILAFTPYNCNSLFIAYQQNLSNMIKEKARYGQGHSVVHIYLNSISKLSVFLPPFEEQQKIAHILSTQDKLIELKQKLIEEKEKQKKYLMQTLLTGKIRLKGFNDEWKKVGLKEILKEKKEYSKKSNNYEHVTLSKDGIHPKTERYYRDYLVKDESKKYKITKLNDICYNPANLKFGVICLNNFGTAIFSPIYVTFKINIKYSVKFISLCLTQWNFINSIRKYEEGTVYERMAVKPKDFILYKINLPTLQEQEAIANIISKADEEIQLLQKDLEQEKLKKKALMQLLLTGIARV